MNEEQKELLETQQDLIARTGELQDPLFAQRVVFQPLESDTGFREIAVVHGSDRGDGRKEVKGTVFRLEPAQGLHDGTAFVGKPVLSRVLSAPAGVSGFDWRAQVAPGEGEQLVAPVSGILSCRREGGLAIVELRQQQRGADQEQVIPVARWDHAQRDGAGIEFAGVAWDGNYIYEDTPLVYLAPGVEYERLAMEGGRPKVREVKFPRLDLAGPHAGTLISLYQLLLDEKPGAFKLAAEPRLPEPCGLFPSFEEARQVLALPPPGDRFPVRGRLRDWVNKGTPIVAHGAGRVWSRDPEAAGSFVFSNEEDETLFRGHGPEGPLFLAPEVVLGMGTETASRVAIGDLVGTAMDDEAELRPAARMVPVGVDASSEDPEALARVQRGLRATQSMVPVRMSSDEEALARIKRIAPQHVGDILDAFGDSQISPYKGSWAIPYCLMRPGSEPAEWVFVGTNLVRFHLTKSPNLRDRWVWLSLLEREPDAQDPGEPRRDNPRPQGHRHGRNRNRGRRSDNSGNR